MRQVVFFHKICTVILLCMCVTGGLKKEKKKISHRQLGRDVRKTEIRFGFGF